MSAGNLVRGTRERLTRGTGRLLIKTAEDAGVLQLPIAVDPSLVPGSVSTGSVVSVYVRDTTTRCRECEGAALEGVTVVDAPALAESFGTTGRRQLVLAVPEADAPPFFALLGSYDTAVLTVVRRG